MEFRRWPDWSQSLANRARTGRAWFGYGIPMNRVYASRQRTKLRSIKPALDSGINFIDTARVYGVSEEIIVGP